MREPRERFGETGGHFFEKGIAKIPGRRTRRTEVKPAATPVSLIKKPRHTRPTKRKTDPFQMAAMIFSLIGLLWIVNAAFEGRGGAGAILPAMWFTIMGSAFHILGRQQKNRKNAEKTEK